MSQKRAPRDIRDLATYPPRRPLLEPTWDVKARYWTSLFFTIAMLAIGMLANLLLAPVVRWLRGR